jgi:nucleoside-diphosphate-sugar epimerase
MEQLKALIVKIPGGRRVGGAVMRALRKWRTQQIAKTSKSQHSSSAKPHAAQVSQTLSNAAETHAAGTGRSVKSPSSKTSVAGTSQSQQNPSTKPRVFVTGSSGHLGSRVVEFLGVEGYDVLGFDVKVDPSENLNNYELLKERMAGCQFVVHTAAIPHPNKGTIEDYFGINVVGSFNVMRAAGANRVKRFIYFSSVGYYGANIKGKLWPAYFPIDEAHPVASVPGRAEGLLDAYNQSKVMAEELLAWYGTNRIFEAISLRLAPANKKSQQYPADAAWKSEPRFRRGAFWTNVDPDTIVEAVKCALEAPGEFSYEPFNICDKYAPAFIDLEAFLAYEYPDVPVKCDLSNNPSLITPAKAERMLGFKPCEDVR